MKKRLSLVFTFLVFSFIFVNTAFSAEYYWENPVTISKADSRFPKTVTNGLSSCLIFQEVDLKKHQVWLSSIYYDNLSSPVENFRFAGPFRYSGDVPDLYSCAMTADGKVSVAVVSDVEEISIYLSDTHGAAFQKTRVFEEKKAFLAPRLYQTGSGGFMLFSSCGENESFNILCSSSSDGKIWSPFVPFGPAENLTNPFIPSLVPYNGGDLVVMQAQYTSGSRISYQLFSTYSLDGGLSWTPAVLITDQASFSSGESRSFTNFQNQQATLFSMNGDVYLSWERTYYASENAALWIARLDENGIASGSAECYAEKGNASRPVLYSHNGELNAVWFDTRSGYERVYTAKKDGLFWSEDSLSPRNSASLFGSPVISDGGTVLSFVWESAASKKEHSIKILAPDTTVSKPNLHGVSFKEGRHSTDKNVRVRVELPDDSSGISGWSYTWGQDSNEEPPFEVYQLPNITTLNLTADTDGDWFFRVRAFDYAGNYSEPATLVYNLDITPPKRPSILFTDTDDLGLASSNAFSVKIVGDESDSDIGGFSYSLTYAGNLPGKLYHNSRHPMKISIEDAQLEMEKVRSSFEPLLEENYEKKVPSRILTKDGNVKFANRKNGVYLLSVTAIDEVGNISESSSILVYLNKYVPYTYISKTTSSVNALGEISLDITGGGFTYDGLIQKIYIDDDGIAPYVMTRTFADSDYQITSDNTIKNVKLGNQLDEGKYKIGLLHADRGLYWSGAVLNVEQNGTVKIEPEVDFIPDWKIYENPYKHSVNVNILLLTIVVILGSGMIVFAIQGYISTAKEAVIIKKEVNALIFGGAMPKDKKKREALLARKGVSLKYKLIGFTAMLVFAIVALVAVPLGYFMTTLQERTLSRGLEERVNVLLESLSSGARAYMPANNVLELSYLPEQASSLNEAKYATIIGEPASLGKAGLDFVWATNDPDITKKIDSDTLNFGNSRLVSIKDGDSELVKKITDNCGGLNETAVEKIGATARSIVELNSEGVTLALKTDKASVTRLEEIGEITTQLNGQLISSLNDISKAGISSYPVFNADILDRDNTDYIFYKPVLYRSGNSQNYVHGVILVEISTMSLVQEADNSRNTVMYISGIVAVLAMIIGAILSMIMSSIIVKPIKKLAFHVKVIGDTKDKSKLKGKNIVVKGKDEIGQLGEIVNAMTQELAKAAEDEKLSLDGKAVQNAFLPLLPGREKTQTVAELKDDKVECFGYYEGASGVSGDYFDYRKLDNRWYVFIKCDASGHGVPAALIMTVVATMFREYFNSWSFQKNGIQLDKLVTKINDAIESLGLKGKFAAMIICLVDTTNGDVYMCNAGDNIVHIYDKTLGKQKILTLTETPAAGPLPSFMVEMKGGFKVEKTKLNHGDVLFLYTDGIEESTRKCRNPDFSIIQTSEKDKDGNIQVEDKNELLEADRVSEIIETVFARGKFILNKEDNPVSGEVLEFDFSQCEGKLEEVILALASVEKIFRFYKTPNAGLNDEVVVDRRIDNFLRDHFNLYDYYCKKGETDDGDQNYTNYYSVLEDEQLDDLTLLAVRRL